MPRTRRQVTVPSPPEEVWRVVGDPHHLPRWWPRAQRVESVDAGRWTLVFNTTKGRPVRADFALVAEDPLRHRAWTQELEDSPFERLMDEAVTQVWLEPRAGETEVTLEVHQKLRGLARFGWFMVSRANRRLLDEALGSLEQACGR